MFEGILHMIVAILMLSPCIHATWHVDREEKEHTSEENHKALKEKSLNEYLCSLIAVVSLLGICICASIATCSINEWSHRFQAGILGAIYFIGLIFGVWRGNIHKKKRIEQELHEEENNDESI